MHRTLTSEQTRPALLTSVPFLMVHLLPLGLFWTGAKPVDWAVCAFLYVSRMFFITGVYHRYFAHRSYKMNRVMQFLMAWGGASSAQKGPLWWASHHRQHHKYSDTEQDIHSPKDGLWWSQVGWIVCDEFNDTEWAWIKDFSKYPELRWLDKYHLVPPVVLGVLTFLVGGWSMLLCGFFLSTTLLYHGTFSINSAMHLFGRRRYATTDTSRNTFLFALLTLGEGWHNNHHYYQSSTNAGFYWWEVDITYYILNVLRLFGLVSDFRKPPQHVLLGNRVEDMGDPAMGIAPPASGGSAGAESSVSVAAQPPSAVSS